MNLNQFLSISTEFDEVSAEGGTKRPQLELAITRCFEVDFQKLDHFWKAKSQGFPTATIRASEDLTCSSYERFEIVPPPAGNRAAFGRFFVCRKRNKECQNHNRVAHLCAFDHVLGI